MKIGIFDSGLGGLYLFKSILKNKSLARYDYVYLGDTKNLPYGNKSQAKIYKLTQNAVEFLFAQKCDLVIIACNTSSAQALRKIQRKFLPRYFKNKKVLGIIRPTVELVALGDTCVIATAATVKTRAYARELRKINPKIRIEQIAAPELVDLIETAQLPKLQQAIKKYSGLIKNKRVANLILGCTHYAMYKDQFAKSLGGGVHLISQDELLPTKLKNYLYRHQEIENGLSRGRTRRFFVTKINPEFSTQAKKWFGQKLKLIQAKI